MILLALFLIVVEALYEALSDSGKKTISGVIEFTYRAVITTIAFLWLMDVHIFHLDYKGIFYIIGGYLLLRFAIFDTIYNLTRGLPLFYIGTTKLFDKFWQWFFKVTNFPVNHFFGMVKFICFLIGITWLW